MMYDANPATDENVDSNMQGAIYRGLYQKKANGHHLSTAPAITNGLISTPSLASPEPAKM
jgi:hypothetical protein